ncbi:hypothetical protein BaRGS_00012846 [Batillaria attramentaria]|uniref:Uncharacterized protein n=1 Tax=Batillaria attramentaria TaxID=370345 RepID=A0ABD0L979_9CAEN
MVVAVVSLLWYGNVQWWHRLAERYLLTSIVCDAGVVVLLKYIIENCWWICTWDDALVLSVWVTLVYFLLEAPHVVYNERSLFSFSFHSLQIYTVVITMLFALVYEKGNRICPEGDRYLLTALLSDTGLVFMLKFVTQTYWKVTSWEAALPLAAWVALMYACLEGPHVVHSVRSLSWFFFHTLHKMAVVFSILVAMAYVKA